MKAVLISIHPRHCENIAGGKKTVEIRRTRPKCDVPFKAFIYETKGRYVVHQQGAHTKYGYGRGKIIGEFVCDKIGQIRFDDDGDLLYEPGLAGSSPCLSLGELQSYIGVNNVGYGWHISDLKIYDKPKELWELCMRCKVSCANCKDPAYYNPFVVPGCEERGVRKLMRPPQSWCYVEGL